MPKPPIAYYRNRREKITVSRYMPLEERFWAQVDKDGPNNPVIGKCWVWTGTSTGRYGGIKVNGKPQTASRVSWEIHFGKIPEGLLICHKCDYGHCVNPDHLFLGTMIDNMQDMLDKGRGNRGFCETHSQAKLTNADVEEIRRLYIPRKGVGILAERFGVSVETIRRAAVGAYWKRI
jgi:hypothetical protein